MSPVFSQLARWHEGFPRVSGDEPLVPDPWQAWVLFSPRERG